MRHRWKLGGTYEFCRLCGLRRRKVNRHCPGVNPARHSYMVWEYSDDNGERWFWLRSRQPVPPCLEGIRV